MRKVLFIIVLLIKCISPQLLFGQESSLSDSLEIVELAKKAIFEYQKRMNLMTNKNLLSVQVDQIIDEMYKPNINQIFKRNAVLENDIDPGYKVDSTNYINIVTYLKNFNLYYDKEDSIYFSELEISPIKHGMYQYVQIRYEKKFLGKNKIHSNESYTTHKKIAELKIEKVDDEWTVFITSISFNKYRDNDNDNIEDFYDKCPNTPEGFVVNQFGCPIAIPPPDSMVYKELSVYDSLQIMKLSENVIFDYHDRINLISDKNTLQAEIDYLISSMYTDNPNQIFVKNATIEDDIKPLINLDSINKIDIETYLKDFNLLYDKANQISFTDLEIEPLTRSNGNLYVHVKYKKIPLRENKTNSDTRYQPISRIAELKIEKDKNDWKVLITNISFDKQDMPHPIIQTEPIVNEVPVKTQENIPSQKGNRLGINYTILGNPWNNKILSNFGLAYYGNSNLPVGIYISGLSFISDTKPETTYTEQEIDNILTNYEISEINYAELIYQLTQANLFAFETGVYFKPFPKIKLLQPFHIKAGFSYLKGEMWEIHTGSLGEEISKISEESNEYAINYTEYNAGSYVVGGAFVFKYFQTEVGYNNIYNKFYMSAGINIGF